MRNWNWTKSEQSNPVAQGQSVMQQMPGLPSSYLTPINQFYQDVDRFFDNAFRNFGLPSAFNLPSAFRSFNPMQSFFTPTVDISTTEKEYTIEMEMPGVNEGDVRIDVSRDGQLCVCGEKRQENEHQDKSFVRVERSYGSFSRTLALPEDVDIEQIEAHFNNGILTITAPRMESVAAQGRRIPVSSGEAPRHGRARHEKQESRQESRQEGAQAAKRAA